MKNEIYTFIYTHAYPDGCGGVTFPQVGVVVCPPPAPIKCEVRGQSTVNKHVGIDSSYHSVVYLHTHIGDKTMGTQDPIIFIFIEKVFEDRDELNIPSSHSFYNMRLPDFMKENSVRIALKSDYSKDDSLIIGVSDAYIRAFVDCKSFKCKTSTFMTILKDYVKLHMFTPGKILSLEMRIRNLQIYYEFVGYISRGLAWVNLRHLGVYGMKIRRGQLLGNWLAVCHKINSLSLSGSTVINCQGVLFPFNLDISIPSLTTLDLDETRLCASYHSSSDDAPDAYSIRYSWENEDTVKRARPCSTCFPVQDSLKCIQTACINSFYDKLLTCLPNLSDFKCTSYNVLSNLASALNRKNRILDGTLIFKVVIDDQLEHVYLKKDPIHYCKTICHSSVCETFPAREILYDSSFIRVCERIAGDWTPGINSGITLAHVFIFMKGYKYEWDALVEETREQWLRYGMYDRDIRKLYMKIIRASYVMGDRLGELINEVLDSPCWKDHNIGQLVIAIYLRKTRPSVNVFVKLNNCMKIWEMREMYTHISVCDAMCSYLEMFYNLKPVDTNEMEKCIDEICLNDFPAPDVVIKDRRRNRNPGDNNIHKLKYCRWL